MKISTSSFGKLPDGREATLYTFKSGQGMQVSITNYGGIVTSVRVPNAKGVVEEVNAGFPTLDGYLGGHPYFGATVGRFANRIAQGRFEIEGVEYNLARNNGPNHLHGGIEGFHTKLWDSKVEMNGDHAELTLRLHSPHMEEGYPGNLDVTVKYNIYDSNEIHIVFEASTDRATHVNLTNHCYFNLSGFRESIHNHQLWIDAHAYLPVDDTQIPTGVIARIDSTPFDFTHAARLREKVDTIPGGIDHCFALRLPRSLTRYAALLEHEESGRWLKVFCTQPGMQIYTGNFLDGSLVGHNGVCYAKHGAVCLETQHFPDSPNRNNFPITLLSPDDVYSHEVRLVFGVNS